MLHRHPLSATTEPGVPIPSERERPGGTGTRHNKPMPTGRVRRTAKVGGLVGSEVARAYATKAANLVRSDEDRSAADARRRLEAAEHVVEVLGAMKGPAMKVGQMASMLDLGGLPPDELEGLQAKLGELRDRAPQASFKEIRKVIEQDLGDRLGNLFAEFEPDAAAAASVGQVYHARLHDGREVAVKVQYPHVAGAVRADLQNLGLILRAAKRLAPGLDAKATAHEMRERISEELDYEHEAQAQRTFARRWRGHPFIFIPNVVTDLCRTRVLVTEWTDGIDFEQLKQAPQATRDRVGEIILRFFYGSLYRFGQFSGDPHPGNFRLQRDGRVAFLDFGMTKTIARTRIVAELGLLRAALDHDPDGVHAGFAALGFFERDDPRFDPARVLDHVRAINAWYTNDEPVALTPQYVSALLAHAGDPRSEYWDLMKNETIPAESVFASRMQAMTLGTVGQLKATANWHRIMSEWIYDSPPTSPLGIAEARFFGLPGVPSRASA
jgi:predicted unusual protein kinase regulating ubiquinone biosynthesis (AarF/ABC1/UbiB family)